MFHTESQVHLWHLKQYELNSEINEQWVIILTKNGGRERRW